MRRSRRRMIRNNWDLYLLIVVPLASLILFNYVPMLGLVIAFKDFKVFKGVMNSDWVGLKHFINLFNSYKFYEIYRNTLLINIYKFIFQFPVPLILALLLNEVRITSLKRSVQTLVYLPHFLSWVVVCGIFYDILGVGGILNTALNALGLGRVSLLANSRYFRGLMVASTMWKESGWSTIVYLSAITAIDPILYEAASVDGAGRWRQTFSITLPNIVGIIAFVMILRASSIIASDTEQVMVFYSPVVYDVGDVVGTYIYREGIIGAKFSYTTAVGLFGSVIGMLMMLGANKLARKYTGRGIW